MPPIYVIDVESLIGRGPFITKEDAATDIADNEVGPEAIVVVTGISGEIDAIEAVEDYFEVPADDEE